MRDFMKGYCLRCKEIKEIVSHHYENIGGLKKIIIGKCETCKNEIRRLLGKEEVEGLIR